MLNRFYTKNGLPWDEDPEFASKVKTEVVSVDAAPYIILTFIQELPVDFFYFPSNSLIVRSTVTLSLYIDNNCPDRSGKECLPGNSNHTPDTTHHRRSKTRRFSKATSLFPCCSRFSCLSTDSSIFRLGASASAVANP